MSKKNLLIVEDEELLVMNIKFLLSHLADKIFTAGNGEEGLAILESHEVHCVITDVSMPVMNGVDFIRTARERGNNVPFIFFTAYGHHELILEVAKYGAYDFLKKPAFEGLEETVARGLQEGFDRTTRAPKDKIEILSEYEEILKEFSKSSKA